MSPEADMVERSEQEKPELCSCDASYGAGRCDRIIGPMCKKYTTPEYLQSIGIEPPVSSHPAESAYRTWREDSMESHGVKAAFFAGYRAALDDLKAEMV